MVMGMYSWQTHDIINIKISPNLFDICCPNPSCSGNTMVTFDGKPIVQVTRPAFIFVLRLCEILSKSKTIVV